MTKQTLKPPWRSSVLKLSVVDGYEASRNVHDNHIPVVLFPERKRLISKVTKSERDKIRERQSQRDGAKEAKSAMHTQKGREGEGERDKQ